jgi:hemerythrin superfamily protein
MNALELIRSDHQKVKNLFEQVRRAESHEQKRRVFRLIRHELTVHAEMEEAIFYPAFEQSEGFEERLDEALEEHDEVRDLLEEMEETEEAEEFDDLFEELVDAVEHHVAEIEGEFFPKARDLLSESELERLGVQMESFRESMPKAVHPAA